MLLRFETVSSAVDTILKALFVFFEDFMFF